MLHIINDEAKTESYAFDMILAKFDLIDVILKESIDRHERLGASGILDDIRDGLNQLYEILYDKPRVIDRGARWNAMHGNPQVVEGGQQ